MDFNYKKNEFFGQILKYCGQILTTLFLIFFFSSKALAKDEINFGITGVVLKEDLVNLIQWQRYLSKHTGLHIKLKFLRSYSEMKNRFKEKQIDFAYVCGATYVDLEPTHNAELLVVPLFQSKPYYESLVITRKENNYKSLDDFKNKLYAFSDPESNSGSLVPQYQLLKRGYAPNKFFSRIIYTYDHGESILAVLDGFVDGASVDSVVYESFLKDHEGVRKKLKIVERFGPYPITPIIVNKSLSEEIKQKLSTALLQMSQDKEGKLILEKMGIDRFALPHNLSYTKIAKLKFILESVQ